MKLRLLLSATALTAFVAPSIAAAQTTTPPAPKGDVAAQVASGETDDADAKKDEDQTITVTGSRIRSPNVTSDIPITSIAGDTFFESGDINIGDALNDLPQLRSTFSQQNPGSGIGIAGLSLLDLRGLGTARTLVLVNGRRHVAADILNNAVSPDVSSIPADLIERVDIVTGGNSAVYGTDAIAGVVNFILRKDFNGFQVRGQAAISEKGFGGNQYVSAMAGQNFADGRGNITLHGEYARQERIFASDVPWFQQNNGLATVDTDAGAGLVNGGDGFPDAIFLRDIRSVTINPYGLIPVPQPTANALCGTGTLANVGGPNSAGTPFNCTYIFTADGRLTPQTGSRYGSGPTGGILGGNGQTGREGQTVSILPFLERYNFNLLSHFEFSPAFEVFLEAKWNRVNALGNNSGPSFIQGQVTQFDERERPRLDNPYLNPADRTLLSNAILAAGFQPRLVSRTALTAADIANVANGSLRFDLGRNLVDVGLRDEKFQRDTYRFVGGVRGTFNGDWGYELSANYGRFDQSQTTSGFIDRQRFVLSIDAGRNPVTGATQCRSQFDAASAIPIQRTDAVSVAIAARNAARLAADIAACQPYNPFGAGTGAGNTAAINYFTRTFTATASLEQLDLMGFVSGDSSQLFELPGGPVRFVLGGEYRREKAFYSQDPFVTDGFTNGVSIPTFSPPEFNVKEAFGELQIPILRDMPFFHELTVTGAGRVSNYNQTGTVYAYNGGVQWSPVRDIRFRGNYARSVRVPNVSETGFPLVPNFANGIGDPCNTANINSSPLRAANCAANVGAANLANLTAITYSLPIVSGSNPNLNAETSDSFTVGGVLQPRFIPGLSLSVDFYDITVNGIIASVAAQTILNNCVDQPQPNIFCSAFTRYLGTGTGPNGERPGAILGNSLIVAPLNFAKRVRRGIDTNLAYRVNLSTDLKFSGNIIYTHNLKSSNYEDPTNPNFENRILSELGDPKDEFRLDTDLTLANFTFGYRLRFISTQYTSTYEAFNGLNGLPPANIDAIEPQKYPAITYSDFRFEWNLKGASSSREALRFYFGVDNAFNQLPPLGTTATGTGSAIYEFRGRNYYAGFRARF